MRADLVSRAIFGLGIVIVVFAVTLFLGWRHHRVLAEAERELDEMEL